MSECRCGEPAEDGHEECESCAWAYYWAVCEALDDAGDDE